MKKKFFVIFTFITLLLLCLSGIISSALALLLGFLFTLLFGKHFEHFTSIAIKYLLQISVIGLGFGMQLNSTLETSKESFGLTVLSISSTLILGYLLAKLLKLDTKLGHLVSSGTSICGGSAIAAISAVTHSKPQKTSIALGVVFLLNAVALFIFPPIGHFFHLTQHQFGIWAAIAIHDTSSVVGASLTYGKEALAVATTVKLARTLWIIPVSILSMLCFKTPQKRLQIPWFILLFILAVISNSYFDLPPIITTGIPTISKHLLVATLFLVGASLSIHEIKATGIRPFVLGIVLWVFIAVSTLFMVLQHS